MNMKLKIGKKIQINTLFINLQTRTRIIHGNTIITIFFFFLIKKKNILLLKEKFF